MEFLYEYNANLKDDDPILIAHIKLPSCLYVVTVLKFVERNYS
jgi:hypothetical protein